MSVQSRELTVTYKIVPPPSTVAPPSLSHETTHRFPVASLPAESKEDVDSELKRYYASLRTSIAEARTKLGEELTAWRDAVGNAELGKEKSVKAEVDDEVEEEENAEE
ncbi:hypothetical protein DEU56DRAFT_280678 [Suillus clintonianus]|uniref:uncharacterized protein n=1 Tax=Suillus clintonianus TaxID=1904413 RepID=UPI001B86514A|nr:uncharacterized protein DEU56DRAFT_280678 [Suillus clintonianus]KAG2141035.1 hypothetical protein DEU56DRAFT_280678 [Suillus clintonianus]